MPNRPDFVEAIKDGPRLHGRCPRCKQHVSVKFTPTVFCQYCGQDFELLQILPVAPRAKDG